MRIRMNCLLGKQTITSPKFKAGENRVSKVAIVQQSKDYEHKTFKYGFLSNFCLTKFNNL